MNTRPYKIIAHTHILELRHLLAKFQIENDNPNSTKLIMKSLSLLDSIARAVEEDIKSLDYSI